MAVVIRDLQVSTVVSGMDLPFIHLGISKFAMRNGAEYRLASSEQAKQLSVRSEHVAIYFGSLVFISKHLEFNFQYGVLPLRGRICPITGNFKALRAFIHNSWSYGETTQLADNIDIKIEKIFAVYGLISLNMGPIRLYRKQPQICAQFQLAVLSAVRLLFKAQICTEKSENSNLVVQSVCGLCSK